MKLKYGSGEAKNSLTIVTLSNVTLFGKPMGRQIKVLFWNSKKENGTKLSDRARRLQLGDLVSARVVFDIGDPDKSTGFELKKSGLYSLVQADGHETYVVHGKIAKVASGKNYFGAYIPIKRRVDRGWTTNWYHIKFFHDAAKAAAQMLCKGDMVFARGYGMKDKTYEQLTYKEMSGSFIKTVHDTV